mmetsp:Transcript_15550/g.32965  ORF Transcript_15550/g.32965 Transcript_15550/m.32965 type:complete len:179 (-) Transcript_15550:108-644(-)
MRAIQPSLALLKAVVFCPRYANGSPRRLTIGSEPIDLASYVLHSLQDMNESGIYNEGLTLHSILWTKKIQGRYHAISMMEVVFASPYFHSGSETESFNVVVMENFAEESINEEQNKFSSKSKDDGKSTKRRRGYAIDRFPKMKEDEIEKMRILKIERQITENEKIRMAHDEMNKKPIC